MNKTIKILIFICVLTFSNIANAADFYPELGVDPFYSSLNPSYVDENEFEKSEKGILESIKEKWHNRNQKKNNNEEEVLKNIDDEINSSNDNDENEINVNFQKEENNKEEENINQNKKKLSEYDRKREQNLPLTKRDKEKALEQEEREKQREIEREQRELLKQLPLKDRVKLFINPQADIKPQPKNAEKVDPSIELTADYMEYYPERYEVEAVGNAKVVFKKENSILTANKIIYNYDRNILTAHEDVILSSSDSTTEGDFIKLDLTKPNGWIENPVTNTEDIKITAKEAFIYSDKIEEYDGVAKVLTDDVLRLGASSFAGYIDQSNVINSTNPPQNDVITNESQGFYKLKAKNIVIDSKDDHDIITVKNADLYVKNRKIAVIPSLKIVTNKQRANVETNIPEFGSESMLGAHIGPAVVLNVPGGSTLKLAPIATYSKDKFGIGAIARFRSENNMTEAAYGTSRERFLLRGRHKLAPGLLLNYSSYTNQNEWFLGYRMPKYSAQLSYSRRDNVDDLKLIFSQMYSAGVFVDRRPGKDFKDAEGRFRWMTQTYKPIFSYSNEEGNIGFNTGIVAQTAATAYTTGDVLGMFRIGPSLSTNIGPWRQSLIYYQTAQAGRSPFDFDRYRYGRSNLVLLESLKVCKYLSLGYLASIAMDKDVKSDDTFQENRILVSVGPEYAKVTVGYDSIRRSTMFLFSMLLGMENSEVEFKKSTINQPDKFGREKSKQSHKKKKKNYKKYIKKAPKKGMID